jgi:hypothetical protein
MQVNIIIKIVGFLFNLSIGWQPMFSLYAKFELRMSLCVHYVWGRFFSFFLLLSFFYLLGAIVLYPHVIKVKFDLSISGLKNCVLLI